MQEILRRVYVEGSGSEGVDTDSDADADEDDEEDEEENADGDMEDQGGAGHGGRGRAAGGATGHPGDPLSDAIGSILSASTLEKLLIKVFFWAGESV